MLASFAAIMQVPQRNCWRPFTRRGQAIRWRREGHHHLGTIHLGGVRPDQAQNYLHHEVIRKNTRIISVFRGHLKLRCVYNRAVNLCL